MPRNAKKCQLDPNINRVTIFTPSFHDFSKAFLETILESWVSLWSIVPPMFASFGDSWGTDHTRTCMNSYNSEIYLKPRASRKNAKRSHNSMTIYRSSKGLSKSCFSHLEAYLRTVFQGLGVGMLRGRGIPLLENFLGCLVS